MNKKHLVIFYLSATLLGMATMAIVGCGSGKSAATSSNPTPTAAFQALLPAGQAKATYVGNASCGKTGCHPSQSTSILATQHAAHSVTCENCHGPASNHVAQKTPDTTTILAYPNVSRDIVCAQCHSTEDNAWKTSTTINGAAAASHSMMVSSFTGSTVTASDVTSGGCYRCHSGSFKARYVDVPLQAGAVSGSSSTNGYPLTTALTSGSEATQVDAVCDALTTAQATTAWNGSYATAECTTCHDPHQTTANLTANGSQYQLRRPTMNVNSSDTVIGYNIGATAVTPGGQASIAEYTTYQNTCSCHNTRGADGSDAGIAAGSTSRAPVHHGPELDMLLGVINSGSEVTDTGIQAPAQRMGTHATSSTHDQCVGCHMPNASHTFTVQLDTSCAPCHSTADASAREEAIQDEISGDLLTLANRMQAWADLAYGTTGYLAPQAKPTTDSWDYTSNIPTGAYSPAEASVPIEIKRARYNYWYVSIDGSLGVHNPFYTRFLMQTAATNLNELSANLIAAGKITSAQGFTSKTQASGAVAKAFVASERAREKAAAFKR